MMFSFFHIQRPIQRPIQRAPERTAASRCLPVCSRSNRSVSLFFFILLLLSGALSAQVGIGTTTPQKDLDVDGTFRVSGAMTLGATEITSTGAELNLLDGNTAATSTVVVGADRVVFNDDGTMKQTAMSDLLTYFNLNHRLGIKSQRGSDIDGEAVEDRSGNSVSLSSDGSTVAIGAYYNDGNGSYSGHVRIYAWNSATSAWEQQGADIDGEAAEDRSGWSVSLSSDGTTVAIGAYLNDLNGGGTDAGHVRIYTWSGSSWAQQGSDIDGEAAYDRSGISVSLSSDGSTVAIGAHFNDGNGSYGSYYGHVRIYAWNTATSAWEQQGSDIDGEAAGDYSGNSVSLSSDGTTVAIGASLNDGAGTDAGHVRIYTWNGSSWAQQGSDIDGEAAGDQSGHSVSLSSDGSTVAIGGRLNDGNGSNSGHVRIYTWSGSSWAQQGSDIDGEAVDDQSGYSVSLSSDGTTVAIGATGNDGNGSASGHVRIYTWNGSSWAQQSSDIDGEAASDFSGYSVSLSSDGSTVAIGANYNDAAGSNAGHVRIYQISAEPLLVDIELGADVTDAENVAAAGAVMNTGDQTIAGVKTFSTTISGSINGNAATVTNGVYTSGDQTIAGEKIFSGNVGIGTTAPSYNLHVAGDGRFSDGLTVSNVAADSYTKYLFFGSDTGVSSNIPYIQGGGTGTGYAMALNPNGGDVGIGTTAPSYKLDVNGDGHYTGGLNVDGYVGIGTTSSSYPLHITSSGPSTSTHAHFGIYNSPASYMDPGEYNRIGIGWTNGYYTNTYVALKVDYGIWASTVTTTSDERVKDITGISNSEEDLSTLSSIEITDYKMKDVVKYGNQTAKKVIAQQLTSVYPQAVSLQTGVIPNIYKVAEIKEGYVALQTDLKKGDRVKLIFIENEQEPEEIVEVLDADQRGFTIENKKNGKVFVYGQEVDDFHVVDYSAVSMLNVSATQELYKLIQEQEAIIAAQQQELTTQQQISDARYEAVVARLNALESMGSKVSNDQ